MKVRLVLFDFDYTLGDSSEAIIDCFNTGLRGLGLPEATSEAIRRTIGLPIVDSLVAVAGEAARERGDEFRAAWRQRSDRIMVPGTRLLPGVRAAVDALHGERRMLGVVSTKYRVRLDGVLEREGLRDRFAVVLGGDDVATPKPAPEGLILAMDRVGVSARETLYVGDSIVDAEAAERAGVRFAAVLTGVTRRDELLRRRVAAWLPNLAGLPERVRRLESV